jgi:hypothetical protein
MNSARRTAIMARLSSELGKRGNWCGETHLQKATYFLQHLFGINLGFEFIIYLHGPYSFELRDHLAGMRADGFLSVKLQPYPYGPSLVPTPRAETLAQRSHAVARTDAAIPTLAEWLGTRSVAELERLSTAFYVAVTKGGTAENWAVRTHELKPHVSLEQALAAAREIAAFRERITQTTRGRTAASA